MVQTATKFSYPVSATCQGVLPVNGQTLHTRALEK
jgi:hypothetical protein